ncbi:DNA cytosine methyltransferase [Odoribacter laneus]|uniref:Cytosine-specific methyltransferase n=1 Tax=Odoribacter laneus YIT 12061 TaxID=742817 RepID=H1DHP1_9BACT|nr:DNA (cytosine-5-)-methyltransferase [Odoribacter laneus]EHP47170.1 DNA (cytosine-5-)-methyltransferase [Odoribacter laneus YIT 12061]
MEIRKYTHGSLFSGIGGFDLGAKMSGIPTLWNCEYEEHKRKILKRHFPNSYQYSDVCTLSNPPYVDIISGGFPCQDISIGNNSNKNLWRNGEIGIKGERSGLWREFARIIHEVRPCYVIIENSPLLANRGFEKVLYDLTQIGYDCEWQCLQATQFSYPHRRERIFVIAYPSKIRRIYHSQIFMPVEEILSKWTSRQNIIPMPIKRFNSESNYERVRMDDGFSTGLDIRRIEDCGNAVIPEIGMYLFECIKEFDKAYSNVIEQGLLNNESLKIAA